MKKIICSVLVFFVLILSCAGVNAESNAIDKSNIYRLHIIANSNSKEDQAVKLCVRNAILEYERSLFDDSVNNKTIAKMLLMNNAKDIQKIAEQTLNENGFFYDVKLSTGIYQFPDRTYNDVFYPKGEYDALRIVLGDGKGENWWCVMFPVLCINECKPTNNADKEQKNKNVKFDSVFVKAYKWIQGMIE